MSNFIIYVSHMQIAEAFDAARLLGDADILGVNLVVLHASENVEVVDVMVSIKEAVPPKTDILITEVFACAHSGGGAISRAAGILNK